MNKLPISLQSIMTLSERNGNLCLFLGVLMLSLANPGSGLPGTISWVLGILGWVPLCYRLLHTASLRQALRDGWTWGMLYHMWLLHWLASLHPLTWMGISRELSLLIANLAWLATSALGGLYIMLVWLMLYGSITFFKNCCQQASGWWQLSIVPILSVIWAYGYYGLNLLTVLGVPAGLVYKSQLATPWGNNFLHWLSHSAHHTMGLNWGFRGYEGMLFASGMLLALALVGGKPISKPVFLRPVSLLLALVCIAAPIVIGSTMPKPADPLANVPVLHLSDVPSIEVIRSKAYNPDAWVKRFEAEYQAKKRHWGLVVLPEGALPHQDTPFHGLSHEVLIAGAFIYENGDIYNGVVVREPLPPFNGTRYTQQVFRKRLLVPFGEMTPLLPEPLLKDMLKAFGVDDYATGISAGDMSQAALPVTIRDTKGRVFRRMRIHPLVCFEAFYPSLLEIDTPKDRNGLTDDIAVFVISNLGWFHGNQQLALLLQKK